jgi:hypothetical protein
VKFPKMKNIFIAEIQTMAGKMTAAVTLLALFALTANYRSVVGSPAIGMYDNNK